MSNYIIKLALALFLCMLTGYMAGYVVGYIDTCRTLYQTTFAIARHARWYRRWIDAATFGKAVLLARTLRKRAIRRMVDQRYGIGAAYTARYMSLLVIQNFTLDAGWWGMKPRHKTMTELLLSDPYLTLSDEKISACRAYILRARSRALRAWRSRA